MRVKDLSPGDVRKWRDAREKIGRQEYGDDHLDRYNLVDLIEEIIDADVILQRFIDRLEKQHGLDDKNEVFHSNIGKINNNLNDIIWRCVLLDHHLAEQHVTDGKGGQRVYWTTERSCKY